MYAHFRVHGANLCVYFILQFLFTQFSIGRCYSCVLKCNKNEFKNNAPQNTEATNGMWMKEMNNINTTTTFKTTEAKKK